ncbi:MAG TPA: amidohydrolase family protein [Micromonosporaceae bacterium]|jgi:cytosine/adenosine deaminase-related metal-dependent hydrolase
MNASAPGSPIILRNGLVLTLDDRRTIINRGDVLVVGDRIAAVGEGLSAPDGALEIDASSGIILPGMIDTHRHMWQTAMRGYGADWTLTQYFVWYYLQFGKLFRPEDIYAGNYLSALEAIDAGVTTSVDWSHGLSSTQHADAAVDALKAIPGRFVLAYGNIHQGSWEWSTAPEFRDFINRRITIGDDMLGFQIAFDLPARAEGDEWPEKKTFEVARELGVPVTTHAGVWNVTKDDGIKFMYDNGFMGPSNIYVHAATLTPDSYHRIAATGGSISVSAESEASCGQGYPSTWEARKYDIPVSLSNDTSVWWNCDMFAAMRSTLNADRTREHFEAHLQGETITNLAVRAQNAVEWATRGGAKALGWDSLVGSLEVGKKADIVLIKNDQSPVMTPIINPYGHVVYQAQRADVDTVIVNGQIVKRNHVLLAGSVQKAKETVERTIEYLVSQMGYDAWASGMNPEIPDQQKRAMDNPYMYTEYKEGAQA